MANNTLLASDSFTSGSLAAGWAAAFGKVTSIVTGSPFVAEPSTTAIAGWQIWTGLTWPNDQTSELTINALVALAGTNIALLTRFDTASLSGYAATLENGVVTIFRYDNGTPTSIKSQSNTISANDVWAFQSAGGVHSLYRNYQRVLWIADATYTSGSVGFAQQSTTAIADSKVGSWRGYNAIQQDGIWQKQGIIIPLVAGDLASTGLGTYQPCVINDGGTYKMWFSGGAAGTTIYLVTSTDGKTWSARTSVLTGTTNGQVVKYQGTYYMFTQASAGSGPIALSTSPDGINWTLNSSNVLSAGPLAGDWDHALFYMLCPPVLFSGTWYMLYVGMATGGANLFKMGVATASSLTGTWTKYASNPVLSNATAACNLVFVGGVWYIWVSAGPSSVFQSGNFYNPGSGVRYQSVDLLTWTNPTHSVHQSQMFESLDVASSAGGCFPCSMIDVGGKAYCYSISSPTDGTPATDNYQIGLAIAAGSIAQIVTQPEDAVQQVAADNFTRADGGLGANWTTPIGVSALAIASNVCQASVTNANCLEVYTGKSFNADQYSEITIGTLTGGTGISIARPVVRGQTGAYTCYSANIQSNTGSTAGLIIEKFVNGVLTNLLSAPSPASNVGDVYRLTVTGPSAQNPNTVLAVYQNGTLVQQVEDYSNAIASGSPGLLIFVTSGHALTSAQVPLWAGGNANVIPNYPAVGEGAMALLGVGQ